MTLCQILTSLLLFQFITNLEQSGSRILDTWSATFSLIITFYLTKTENKIKKSPTQLSYSCFEKWYFFWPKNVDFFFHFCRHVIVIFPIYSQSEAIRKPDSGRIVCKTYISINGSFLSKTETFYHTKTENRTKKSLTQLSYYCFE